MAWNGYILSTGSQDCNILQRDVRQPDQYVMRHQGHSEEVCGLKWSHDEKQLASGGNEGNVCLWSLKSQSPILRFNEHHGAAVRAIAWSPHQRGLLASGGGTMDRSILIWNTVTNTPRLRVHTGSQVCNLLWSKNVNEIVSTHGYANHEIVIWKYPSMVKVATLLGHTARVLHVAVSRDGRTLATAAGDSTLRFWNAFPPIKSPARRLSFHQTIR